MDMSIRKQVEETKFKQRQQRDRNDRAPGLELRIWDDQIRHAHIKEQYGEQVKGNKAEILSSKLSAKKPDSYIGAT